MSGPFSRIPEEDKHDKDDPTTGLRFTDVLFGFVFKELFTRLTAWQRIDNVTRAHLIMSTVLVLGSYIGFRNSSKRGDFKIRFFNLPFLKFAVDQGMVVLYFFIATKTPVPNQNTMKSDPKLALTGARFLLAIAILYLVWDLLSWWMCTREYSIKFEPVGVIITGGLCLVSFVLLKVGWSFRAELTSTKAVGLEAAMIAALVLYRFAKDHRNPLLAKPCCEEPAPQPAA